VESNDILTCFDRSTQHYDAVANVQRCSALALVSKLASLSLKPNSILDVGTGTGYLSQCLVPLYPHAQYFLNDIAPNRVHHAHRKLALSGVTSQPYLGDIEQIQLPNVDMIVSNLALQWAQDLTKTLNKLSQTTQTLAFSCLLEDSFSQWKDVLKNHGIVNTAHPYPKLEHMVTLCQNLGIKNFIYDTLVFKLYFDNPLKMMHYLKQLGANAAFERASFSKVKKISTMARMPVFANYHIFLGILSP
jgi:malonyl-CoA O-methyltransferase